MFAKNVWRRRRHLHVRKAVQTITEPMTICPKSTSSSSLVRPCGAHVYAFRVVLVLFLFPKYKLHISIVQCPTSMVHFFPISFVAHFFILRSSRCFCSLLMLIDSLPKLKRNPIFGLFSILLHLSLSLSLYLSRLRSYSIENNQNQ